MNEFQDESNESLEPQDNSTPASNDNISQDSAPEEVGNAANFLASDFASGITCETLFVDAGFNISAMGSLEDST